MFKRFSLETLSLGLLLSLCSCSDGGDNCFLAGTMIATPTGEQPIETLKVGDAIIAYDFNANTETVAHIKETYIHHADKTVEHMTLTGGQEIDVTPEHPFYSVTKNTWVKAGDLAGDEQLLVRTAAKPTQVKTRESHANTQDVYNIEVDGPANYFAAGVLVKYY